MAFFFTTETQDWVANAGLITPSITARLYSTPLARRWVPVYPMHASTNLTDPYWANIFELIPLEGSFGSTGSPVVLNPMLLKHKSGQFIRI